MRKRRKWERIVTKNFFMRQLTLKHLSTLRVLLVILSHQLGTSLATIRVRSGYTKHMSLCLPVCVLNYTWLCTCHLLHASAPVCVCVCVRVKGKVHNVTSSPLNSLKCLSRNRAKKLWEAYRKYRITLNACPLLRLELFKKRKQAKDILF